MPNITVEISDIENQAMEVIALSPQDWVSNFVHNRARKSIDNICEVLVNHCNENNIAIAVGKEAQVAQAFSLNLVQRAADIDVTLPSVP